MKKHFLKIAFLSLQILAVFYLTGSAQNEPKQSIVLPIIPAIVEYEYAPYYISQDIKDHPQYSLIEAIFTPDDTSSVQIILTEKETKKRIFYCNSETIAKMRILEGKETVLTKIDFKPSKTDNQLPLFGFGFLDKNGQPVLWRVLPTSSPSKQGAGLTPIVSAPDLRLEYRDTGTTIGEGSAIKIGTRVIEAEPWAQISSPPYFYAFHGSFTIGRHIGALRLGTEKWRVESQPKELKKGGEWVLVNEKGNRRNLRIVSDSGDELIIDEAKSSFPGSSLIRIVIHISRQGYNLRAMEMRAGSNVMRIKFEPELPLQSSNYVNFEGAFMINQGENKNIATGMIFSEQTGNDLNLKWQIKSPDWAKSRVMETSIKIESEGYSIETKRPQANP